MKILFLNLSHLKFDVETPLKAPLGGTESAIAYLATALAARGHDVSLMALTDAQTLAGVKHIPVKIENIGPTDPDVIIAASAPEAWPKLKELAPRAKLVLWNHMLPNQPSMQHLFNPAVQQLIEHMVFVSEVQKNSFVSSVKDRPPVTVPDMTVINNAISPAFENMFGSADEILKTKQCKAAYTSTPFRGLACLSKIQELTIDIYSSMAVYQGDDAPYQKMYETLRANDCLVFHGSLSQTDLAAQLRETAFWTYPSIFQECHSIALLEAMAAGCKVITTDLAIDKSDFADIIPFASATVNDYAVLLRKNINSFRSRPEEWAARMFEQVQYVNREFTWKKKAAEWETYLLGLK